MIQKTLAEIEARLWQADSVRPETKRELLDLLSALRVEVDDLSKTQSHKAKSIADHAKISAQEAIRAERNPEEMKLSLEGLSASVSGFEKSHPKLVEVVNRICTTLSNMGI